MSVVREQSPWSGPQGWPAPWSAGSWGGSGEGRARGPGRVGAAIPGAGGGRERVPAEMHPEQTLAGSWTEPHKYPEEGVLGPAAKSKGHHAGAKEAARPGDRAELGGGDGGGERPVEA